MGYATMSEKMAKTAMLHHLYVRPACQGQGIGRDIFAEMETCFPADEIMRVEVALQNKRAILFSERLGFFEVDRMAEFGGSVSGLAAGVLETTLSARGGAIERTEAVNLGGWKRELSG